MVLATLDGLIS